MAGAKRLEAIDVYKGISILAITFLHFEDGVIPSWLNVFIGSFMITAFYLTAGWIAGSKEEQGSTKEFVRKRLKSLGVPYLWFTLIILCFDVILLLFGYYDIQFIAREVYKTITFRGIGTLWFLPAIFFGEILLFYLRKKPWYILVAMIAIVVVYSRVYEKISCEYRNLDSINQIIDAPFKTLSNIATAFIVLTYSYYTAKWHKMWRSKPNDCVIAVLMIAFLGIYLNQLFNPINIPYSGYLFSYLLLFGMFMVSYFISKLPLIKEFLSFWGRNSLIMMGTHYPIVHVLCEIFNKYILGNEEFTGMITIYLCIFTIIIEYPIVYLINRKAPFLIGK